MSVGCYGLSSYFSCLHPAVNVKNCLHWTTGLVYTFLGLSRWICYNGEIGGLTCCSLLMAKQALDTENCTINTMNRMIMYWALPSRRNSITHCLHSTNGSANNVTEALSTLYISGMKGAGCADWNMMQLILLRMHTWMENGFSITVCWTDPVVVDLKTVCGS